MKYDLIIIGSGPGGYVSAIRASQLGLKTALIEKSHVGGTCLNVGCIPTKSFVAVAENFKKLRELNSLGIENVDISNAAVSLQKIIARKTKIIDGLRAGILQLLKANKVDFIQGTAKLISAVEVEVAHEGGGKISASNIIIATGSSWRPLPGLVSDGNFILNSDHMLGLHELPEKLLIVGGGAIGCEFASIMNAFGSSVTIVEASDQLLPMEDAMIARALASSFTKRGIKILTQTTVAKVTDHTVVFSSGDEIVPSRILVSVGRRPFIDGLGLENAGIETKNGFVLVDENMQTNVKNIYAIGDVSAYSSGEKKPMLAHVASRDGVLAVAKIAEIFHVRPEANVSPFQACPETSVPTTSSPRRVRPETSVPTVVPSPIFTIPEIASVGSTEKELKAKGINYKIGRFSYAALSKAVCDGQTDGMMQAYVGDDGKILGAHFMGNHASDICSEIAVAMQNGISAEEVINTIHAHPTYSEILVETLEDAFGKAIHKVGIKR